MDFVVVFRIMSSLVPYPPPSLKNGVVLHPISSPTTTLLPHSHNKFTNKLNFVSGAEFGSEHPALKILPSGDQVGFT